MKALFNPRGWFLFPKTITRTQLFFRLATRDLKLRYAIYDYIQIWTRLFWTFLIHFLMAITLIFLPQGQDLLLTAVEDWQAHKILPIAAIIASLITWSTISYFTCRTILNFTDNSLFIKNSLRLRYRKMVVRMLPRHSAVLPFIVLIAALIKLQLSLQEPYLAGTFWFTYIVSAIIFFVLFRLYWEVQFKHPNVPREAVYLMTKLTSVLDDRHILLEPGKEHPVTGELVKEPTVFFTDNMYYNWLWERRYRVLKINELPDNRVLFRYIYKIILWLWIALMGLFLIMNAFHSLHLLGSIAILILGLSAWNLFFFLVFAVDKLQPNLLKSFCKIFLPKNQTGFRILDRIKTPFIPYRIIVALLFVLVSFTNNDHPLRQMDKAQDFKENRITLDSFSLQWIQAHYPSTPSVAPQEVQDIYPVFVCAEGGALRTGCFTSMLLAKLSDSIPGFRDHLFAYSTVSGGSVGAGVFNTVQLASPKAKLYPGMEQYFKRSDYLAPIIQDIFFGEFLQLFSFGYFEHLDRAVTLEKVISKELKASFSLPDSINMETNFYLFNQANGLRPAVFINTTQAEEGLRSVFSNVKISSDHFVNCIDLAEKVQSDVRYSTACCLSARFPLVSPSGMLWENQFVKKHYLDGGYFENMGDATILEVIKGVENSVEKYKLNIRVVPIVIQVSFDSDTPQKEINTNLFNDILDVMNGLYDVRNGHTKTANSALKDMLKEMEGHYFEFTVGNSVTEVPMSWTLSGHAIGSIHDRISKLTNSSTNPMFSDLYSIISKDALKIKK